MFLSFQGDIEPTQCYLRGRHTEKWLSIRLGNNDPREDCIFFWFPFFRLTLSTAIQRGLSGELTVKATHLTVNPKLYAIGSTGRHNITRHALAFITIIFAFIGSSVISYLITDGNFLQWIFTGKINGSAEWERTHYGAIYVLRHYGPYLLVGLILPFITEAILERSLITFISYDYKIRFRKIIFGFLAWISLEGAFSLYEHMEGISPLPNNWLNLGWVGISVAIFLIVIQASAEELIFRAYIPQIAWNATHNANLAAFLSFLVFLSSHLDGQISWIYLLWISSFSSLLTLVSFAEQRLETSIGIHAANNIWFGLLDVRSYQNSDLTHPMLALETARICIIPIVFGIFLFCYDRISKVSARSRPCSAAHGNR
jgi:membrane protease YdiL (CAAX protease family)